LAEILILSDKKKVGNCFYSVTFRIFLPLLFLSLFLLFFLLPIAAAATAGEAAAIALY
jgi:hypothetical protein